jgi:phospholipid/cholesterol/gamma-HCH transport system substrate-binding protein
MLSQRQKARLGLFVLLSTGLLSTAVTVLAGRAIFSPQDRYRVHFTESVSGLEEGAPVKLNGVRVGSVEHIRILPEDIGKVDVRLALLPGTPVKVDTTATIATTGLTGLRYVELARGTREAKLLRPGSVIPTDPSFLSGMSDKADAIMMDMHQLLRQVVEMTSSENQEKITSIMDSFSELAENSKRLVETSQSNLSQGVELLEKNTSGIAELTARLNAMVEESSGRVRSTTEATERAAQGLEQTLAELSRTLVASRTMVENLDRNTMQGIKDMSTMMRNLDRTLGNLEELSRTLKDQPSSLLIGRRGGRN